MIHCFRLSSGRFKSNTGTGAARYGGRWNPKGVEAIYTAATISLAALEVLVHFAVLPRDFVLTETIIPSNVAIEHIAPGDLPEGWQRPAPSSATQEIGRRWAVGLKTAAVCVPSTIIPRERIYVINPAHPDFEKIRFLSPVPFQFDPRLK